MNVTCEYVYRGDRWTEKALKGMRCSAVRRLGRCIRGKNGNMLVVDDAGRRHAVQGRQLRKQPGNSPETKAA